MALEEQLLTASLIDTFREANEVLDKLYRYGPRSVAEAEEPSEEFEEADRLLAH